MMKDGRLIERPMLVVLLRGLLLLVLIGAVGVLWFWQGPAIRSWLSGKRPGEALDVFGSVPDFSLIERSGRKVNREDLLGKVSITNFIFTHCLDTCPLQSAEMAKLQADFLEEKDLRLVSITVDPERDTPEVLSRYAKRYGADPERWLFLTGEKKTIYRLALEGFRLNVADPAEGVKSWLLGPAPLLAHHEETGTQFIHSSRFVLVDRRARIRGYYHSNEHESLQRLRRDARVLLRGEK
ncbi:MAG TPA: SCO family protein [Candidatus Methylomirabilis sp.]|nr:SCO family protein [Candidatus Methylomirabilis sp.]